VGTASTWAAMTSPQRVDGQHETGYGFGLMRGHYRGVETLFHPGGGMGGNAQMLKVQAAGLDVVVIVNRHDAWASELANSILDACLPELEPRTQILEKACVTGVFRSGKTGRVIQLAQEHGKQIATIDGFDWPYVRETDDILRPIPIWRFVNQEIHLASGAGPPDSIRFYDCGQVDNLERVDVTRCEDAGDIAGVYSSDTTGTRITLVHTSGGEFKLNSSGRFGSVEYRVEAVARGLWRARPTGALPWLGGWLLFDSQRRGLQFTSLRTWALPFRREN
jgi:hypothetical protein